MSADKALFALAAQVGIFPEFTDMRGVRRTTSPETIRALLRANGLRAETVAQIKETRAALEAELATRYLPEDVVIQSNTAHQIALPSAAQWVVLSEADDSVLADGAATTTVNLPPIAAGVHLLRLEGAYGTQTCNLIVAPLRAPSLMDVAGQERLWGVVAALYGMYQLPGQTLGTYQDLGAYAAELGRQGASFLGINPVHALGTAAADTISPYSPTHRGFLNSDHIAPPHPLDAGAARGRVQIDYPAHRAAHRPAMLRAFETFQAQGSASDRAAFEQFCAESGAPLAEFARFEALSESHGPDWRQWPAKLRDSPADAPPPLVEQERFHMWMQWHADHQLAKAQNAAIASGMPLGLYLDLAVGARAGGAESWGATAATASGVTLGAPPDHLSPAGQNWQLAALSPNRLQKSRYRAFQHVLRQTMRHCGLLRIDHALGLKRSYWIPEDGSPGGYIRQNFQALVGVIAIEAQRAGTVVVGEDLGLVPDGFRDEMAACGFYGYSVLQYEKGKRGRFHPIKSLRQQSLACFGTHDTPTLAGFWQGSDIAWWEKLGWITTKEAARAVDTRAAEKRQLADIRAPTPLPPRATRGVRDSIHARLASAPAALVAVQADDILLVPEAQNLPGTVSEHPNWQRRYPRSAAEMTDGEDLRKTADIMADADRAAKTRKDTR